MVRPATVVVALVAGTAVRFLITALPPFRNRRRARSSTTSSTTPRITRPHSPPRRSRPSTRLSPHHHQILRLLDIRAPPESFLVWSSTHPDPAECTFCLDSIRPSKNGLIRQTPCGHSFHAPCLERWVLYVADECLDWTRYSLADDGAIDAHVRHPTCPNCAADLNVMPEKLLRHTLLTTVARSLSLRDLAAAAQMYDAGLVYRVNTSSQHPTTAISFSPPSPPRPPPLPYVPLTRRPDSIAFVATPSSSTSQASPPTSFTSRADSTASEPYLPALAFVAHTEGVVHAISRRSLPEDLAGPRSIHQRDRRNRGWRRRADALEEETSVMLQVFS